jgi:hypothetical protein
MDKDLTELEKLYKTYEVYTHNTNYYLNSVIEKLIEKVQHLECEVESLRGNPIK